jgi:hypothetical protein
MVAARQAAATRRSTGPRASGGGDGAASPPPAAAEARGGGAGVRRRGAVAAAGAGDADARVIGSADQLAAAIGRRSGASRRADELMDAETSLVFEARPPAAAAAAAGPGRARIIGALTTRVTPRVDCLHAYSTRSSLERSV